MHLHNVLYITCTVNAFDSMVASAVNAVIIIFQLRKIMLDYDFIHLP